MLTMEPLPVEALLADYPGPMREIAEWLRGVVARAVATLSRDERGLLAMSRAEDGHP